MSELIKEDVLSVIKKKRFIVLMALAFIGAVADTIIAKSAFWNDLIYLFAMQKYVLYFFNPIAGLALIISVYRKKFTRNSILQVEEKNLKRPIGVISRLVSGALILAASYLLFAVFTIIMGFIFGAHMTAADTGILLLRLLMDCLANIAVYSLSLFFLYLFAFPIVPVFFELLFMLGVPAFFVYLRSSSNIVFKTAVWFVPKTNTDSGYTNLLLSNPDLKNAGIYLIHLSLPFLLTLMVFRLKKLKPLKKAENTEVTDGQPV